ncbi:class B sortase [Fusibacter bizertensis]|uniref:Class B sortase n=1 Tax=Fusibacter bizertensis TaxID=1488331 RepID=A0ABT6NCY2_9FIRM|nr:class B sortase [Fusibacter bizertensis]MDH8678235.1 class B sortase [Fusibacter bizertensis]
MKNILYCKLKPFFLYSMIVLSIIILTSCDTNPHTTTQAIATTEITTESISTTESDTTSETTTEKIVVESTPLATVQIPFSITTNYPYKEYRDAYEDFVGWISIPGTKIDYPIVQTTDNEHYLNYDYTNSKNYAGAVYMDYKNKGNFYDNHISLYGHYMKNGTMFHDLHLFKEQSFFNENHSIYLTGLREKFRYEIYSVQIVSAYTYRLYLNLDASELNEYALHFQRESLFDHEIENTDQLKLLTLVTCTYEFDNARLLIHAYQAESVPFD